MLREVWATFRVGGMQDATIIWSGDVEYTSMQQLRCRGPASLLSRLCRCSFIQQCALPLCWSWRGTVHSFFPSALHCYSKYNIPDHFPVYFSNYGILMCLTLSPIVDPE